MPYALLIAGIALLLIGGTLLVRGASGIARGFNVSAMMIGLTVVAFGTSTPELVVNITGALQGETELAFGNAVGSNLANFGLVLGFAAVLSPIYLEGQVVRREEQGFLREGLSCAVKYALFLIRAHSCLTRWPRHICSMSH